MAGFDSAIDWDPMSCFSLLSERNVIRARGKGGNARVACPRKAATLGINTRSMEESSTLHTTLHSLYGTRLARLGAKDEPLLCPSVLRQDGPAAQRANPYSSSHRLQWSRSQELGPAAHHTFIFSSRP